MPQKKHAKTQRKAKAEQATSSPQEGKFMEELYNALMMEIEPDLLTENISELDRWYEDETEEESKERGERYARAFALCSARFRELVGKWKEQILTAKKTALRKGEAALRVEEGEMLKQLDRSLGEA